MSIRTRLIVALAFVAIVPPALLVLRAGPILRELKREAADGLVARVEKAAPRVLADERDQLERAMSAWVDSLTGGGDPPDRLLEARSGRRLRESVDEAMRLAGLQPLERPAIFRATGDIPPSGIALSGDDHRIEDAIGTLRRGRSIWEWDDHGRLTLRVASRWPDGDPPFLVFVAERSLDTTRLGQLLESLAGAEMTVLPWRPGRPPARSGSTEATIATPDGMRLGVARLDGSVAGRLQENLLRSLVETAAVGGGVALLLALVLATSLSRPVRELARAVERVTDSGEEGHPPMPGGTGEMGVLASALDRTFVRLRAEHGSRLEAERLAGWRDVARRVAHEVKNPLTPIRLAVGNLRRRAAVEPARLAAAVDEEGSAIEHEVMRLERLVREFSEFARLPAPRLEPVRLGELLSRAVSLHGSAPGVEITVRLDPALPETLRLDADLIATAVGNLLGNAVVAIGEAGGRVTVEAAPAPSPTDATAPGVSLVVQDDGPGIPDELLPRIFEPYVTGRDGSGTGLGLAIARRVVLDHGGWMSARNDRGAHFTIWLPVR